MNMQSPEGHERMQRSAVQCARQDQTMVDASSRPQVRKRRSIRVFLATSDSGVAVRAITSASDWHQRTKLQEDRLEQGRICVDGEMLVVRLRQIVQPVQRTQARSRSREEGKQIQPNAPAAHGLLCGIYCNNYLPSQNLDKDSCGGTSASNKRSSTRVVTSTDTYPQLRVR
jgi:hypothetical protein